MECSQLLVDRRISLGAPVVPPVRVKNVPALSGAVLAGPMTGDWPFAIALKNPASAMCGVSGSFVRAAGMSAANRAVVVPDLSRNVARGCQVKLFMGAVYFGAAKGSSGDGLW